MFMILIIPHLTPEEALTTIIIALAVGIGAILLGWFIGWLMCR